MSKLGRKMSDLGFTILPGAGARWSKVSDGSERANGVLLSSFRAVDSAQD
jgi:hypothetical protein